MLDMRLKLLGAMVVMALLAWGYYWRCALPASEKYATLFPRFWGGIVDGALLGPLLFIQPALVYLGWPHLGYVLTDLLGFSIPLIYAALLLAKYGQTVGCRVTRVRLVDARSEGPVTARQAWWREGIFVLPDGLKYMVLLYLCLIEGVDPEKLLNLSFKENSLYVCAATFSALWALVSFIVMLCNEKRRTVVDYLSGTVVIRTNLSAEPVVETSAA